MTVPDPSMHPAVQRGWLAEYGLARLESMLKIRIFEERVRELRITEEIVGSVHLCIGQESVPVAMAQDLRPEDRVLATYRGHGWAVALGVPLVQLFGELLGREIGTNGGRAGSAFLSAADSGFLGENSIVGAGAPIACGVALAAKRTGSGAATVCVFGDGAINQGAVAEALNFAGALRLPVVFVCENNGWSELTAIETMVADPLLYRRGIAYGLESARVDGNDLAVLETAFRLALEKARADGGPSFLEVMTQRLVGHYIGDAELYRQPGETERNQEAEAVARLTRDLLEGGAPTESLDSLKRRVESQVDVAARDALTAPLADPASVREHLYA